MLRSLAIAVALIAAPVASHAQVTPNQKAAIALAIERGKLIYAYDQAAWHGTDDMFSKVERAGDKIGGWIVDGPPESPTIIFFDRDAADPHAVYVGEFRGTTLASGRVLGPNDDRSLSPERKAMIAARGKAIQAWIAAGRPKCSEQSPNTVVLPPERPGGPYLVYILSPQTQDNIWPLGGHFRVEIGADGSVGPLTGLAASCLSMPAPQGGKNTPMTVAHPMGPIPTEVHVFTALGAQVPLFVRTGTKTAWWVTGQAIKPRKFR